MKYECSKDGSTPFNGRLVNYRKGENDVPAGALDHVGSCKVVTQSTTGVIEESYPTYKGGGYYELSNGEKVQGKEEAIKAEQNL